MEICIAGFLWIGVATTTFRLSWLDRAWPTLLVAAFWSLVPWLAGDLIAGTNAARIYGWATELDHPGAIATLAVVEAVAGGWAALGLAGGMNEEEWQQLSLRRKAVRWASALAPSPTLAVGILGAHVMLYQWASGWGFTSLNLLLSTGCFAALVTLTVALRLVQPDVARRAGGAVPLFAGLFAFGAALPPLIDRRLAALKLVEVDARATAILALIVVASAGLGLARRWFPDSSQAKGAKAR
ncbi:hypothetical protein SAMN05444166_8036 [Singulisphaera sp. GP187]|uniref:hypothetical protein n=1 Tax=Singulisphaera sp. GP187 TaxID=1882752 RepID=UPI000928793D|nr:hypothetical protein [Singulisphaera sp. GP187]SIO66305.1 hypothetical protein SAMN05444166_8036 [Singulisphaera sp. GP187]